MMSLAFAVCIFHYAVTRHNCAAVDYDMHVGSLILELVLVSSFLLRTFRKRSSVHDSAGVSETRRRE